MSVDIATMWSNFRKLHTSQRLKQEHKRQVSWKESGRKPSWLYSQHHPAIWWSYWRKPRNILVGTAGVWPQDWNTKESNGTWRKSVKESVKCILY